MGIEEFQSAVIREWKGKWLGNEPGLPKVDAPPGGFVITFHKGLDLPHKAEHYDTVEAILEKYKHRYFWMQPDPRDSKDIVLVGI